MWLSGAQSRATLGLRPQRLKLRRSMPAKGRLPKPGRRPKVSLPTGSIRNPSPRSSRRRSKAARQPAARLLELSLGAIESRADQGRAAQGGRPRRPPAADPQGRRAGLQPDHQGEVRAGPPALLRPAGLARRHGELCDLPQPGQGLDRRRTPSRPASRARPATATPRRSFNTAYGKTMFWDGRAPSLEGQAQGPMPEPDRDGQADVQADRRAAARHPGYTRAVREGLRHQRHARRHGQGDRHLRAGRRALGQLQVRQVQRRRQQGPHREREARHGPVRPAAQHATTSSSPASSSRRPSAPSATSGRTSPTSSSTTWASAGTRRPRSSPTSAAGPSIRSGPRTDADLGAFKTPTVREMPRRPARTCTTAA